MPKVCFEIEVTSEQIAALFANVGLGKTCTPIVPVASTPEPEAAPADPKPAKEKKKVKAEKVEAAAEPAKTEEPKPAKVSKATLETVRAKILDACKALGTNDAIAIVEKVSGVRKAADIDPSKFEAVEKALIEAKEQAAIVG